MFPLGQEFYLLFYKSMDLNYRIYRIVDLKLSKIVNTATSLGKAEAGLALVPMAAKLHLSAASHTTSKKNFQ